MSHSVFLGKIIKKSLQTFNLGSGSTWPGHIALSSDPTFVQDILEKNPHLKVILVAGTNGKTTTSLMIKTILEKSGKRVFQNESGANLLNGIASTLLQHANLQGKINYDFAIFEVDENALSHVLHQVTPAVLVFLNLFRDQLDRYGELNTISEKWATSLKQIEKKKKTVLVSNADDPRTAYLGILSPLDKSYFSLKLKEEKSTDSAADSLFCPQCNNPLSYLSKTYSHLGSWKCTKCGLTRPNSQIDSSSVYPLDGTYNMYNTNAAILTCIKLGITDKEAEQFLTDFQPAFGRQEKIEMDNKYVQIFLSKNPAGFDQSLDTIVAKKPNSILFILNDRVPDGRDVSWIWDTRIEQYNLKSSHLISSGDRAFDMGLRIKYAFPNQKNQQTVTSLHEAIEKALSHLLPGDTLYILPTYSAMLEVRKALTGKKIL